jgi:hypothetical protein
MFFGPTVGRKRGKAMNPLGGFFVVRIPVKAGILEHVTSIEH